MSNYNYTSRLSRIVNQVIELNSLLQMKYEGQSATIPRGEYKGRRGRIERIHVVVFGNRVSIDALIRPYNLKRQDGSTLNERADARTYWNFEEVVDTVDAEHWSDWRPE